MCKTLIFLFSFIIFSSPLFAQTQNQNTYAVEQAKSDYRVFLQELKKLNEEYKGVTKEIRKIVAEEGVPTFDENTGAMTIQKLDLSEPAKSGNTVFGDADVRETDNEMVVTMDLPGVNKKEIKIGIEGNRILKVSASRGESKDQQKETDDAYYRKIERVQGSFERKIELPVVAEIKGTTANYENGVLTVRVKKSKESSKEVSVPVS